MARILFKFITYLYFERVLKHEMVKSKIFKKLSANFWLNAIKALLLQISLRFEIVANL